MLLRLVLDTSVMVAAFASAGGASRRLLLAALDGHCQLLLSTPLLVEYEAVLTRAPLLAMAKASVQDVSLILDELVAVCVPVNFDYSWRPQAFDPDDDLVLETAINGIAHLVASFNVADMRDGAQRFGIRVERPGVALRRLYS